MKNYFSLNVDPKDFFKTYILFYLLSVVVGLPGGIFPNFFLPFVGGVLNFFGNYISILFGFVVYKYFVSRAMYRDSAFSSTGKLPDFAVKALLWIFLTIITLGIYTPWLIRNIVQYYLENTQYKGKNGEFLANGSTLLKYALLILLGIAVTLFIGVLIALAVTGEFDSAFRGNFNFSFEFPGESRFEHAIDDASLSVFFFPITLPFGIITFLLLVSLFYFFMFWLINFRFAGYSVKFSRKWSESFPSILVEFILSAITLGIYAPAAYININRFFLSGSKLMNAEGTEVGTLGFDEKITAEGFRLIWGQVLLTIITLGIYGAWAICKIQTWLLSHTFIEGDVSVDEAAPAEASGSAAITDAIPNGSSSE